MEKCKMRCNNKFMDKKYVRLGVYLLYVLFKGLCMYYNYILGLGFIKL